MTASSVSFSLRVRYAETDQMQVAHHANYFVWFEAARSEFCRQRGIDYGRMERDGYFLPVLEAHCRYRSPARYDDDIVVTVTVTERTRKTLKLKYHVHRGDALLAEGDTTQMVIDRAGKPASFPAELATRFDEPTALD